MRKYILSVIIVMCLAAVVSCQKIVEKEADILPTPTIELHMTIIPLPTSTPTSAPTDIPTPTFTPIPTATPTFTPTPSPKPTNTPTPKPTKAPTPKPTKTPTPKPSSSSKSVAYPTGAVGTKYTDDPNGHTWKPYARYQKITNKNSVEYKLREKEKTDENGMRYLIDPNGVKRYCIALEPMWAGGQSVDIGRCIDILMTNGTTLHCVLCDCKRTEKSWKKEGWYGSQGELIEFIVDMNKLPDKPRLNGDISYLSKEFEGGITSITVLDLYIEGFGH
ncbi:MAG: hypothetical protein J5617_03855 [Bacilli bacterium]|nr:hypothetical protein [Bacilli bacterium]